jgi:uncharacterized coiled-coil DUF342 family protein
LAEEKKLIKDIVDLEKSMQLAQPLEMIHQDRDVLIADRKKMGKEMNSLYNKRDELNQEVNALIEDLNKMNQDKEESKATLDPEVE